MSQTYSDVDASADPRSAVDWQVQMAAWPGVRAYKQRTYELVAADGLVIDVGCGPGLDVLALGSNCIGVDSSATMVETAARRGASVCRADVHELPFPDRSVHAARSDRVFQHLSDPVRGLHELARVLVADGRVVIADPDQESLVIEVPGVRQSVLDRLKSLRRDVGYRNGTLISKVPALLQEVGLQVSSVDGFTLVLDDPADAFGLPEWPHRWRTDGRFTDEELGEWDAAMVNAGTSGFIYVVTFLVVAATKR